MLLLPHHLLVDSAHQQHLMLHLPDSTHLVRPRQRLAQSQCLPVLHRRALSAAPVRQQHRSQARLLDPHFQITAQALAAAPEQAQSNSTIECSALRLTEKRVPFTQTNK